MIATQTKEKILNVIQPYGPKMVGVFGSFARGEQKPESDIDIVVEFEEDLSLLDIIGIEQKLSEELGLNVDLMTKKSIHSRLKPYIEKDLIRID